jgi:hypothetical protein
MLTDLGPGVVPYQFALIRKPPSNTLHQIFWSEKYVSRQRLEAAGWDQSDPVFYEQCKGHHPHGAIELSWVPRQVLQNTPNTRLPSIPTSQLRYLSARAYATLTTSVASILSAAAPVFELASVGAASGVDVTHYGPAELTADLALTDVRGRREHYSLSLAIDGPEEFDLLAQQHPQSSLDNHRDNFSGGGATFTLSYNPLTARGRSTRTRTLDVIFPLHVLRILLRSSAQQTFAKGRLAAML